MLGFIPSIYNGHGAESGVPDNEPSHTTTINCPLIFPHGGAVGTGAAYGDITETTLDLHLNGPIEVDHDPTYNSGYAQYLFVGADSVGSGSFGSLEQGGGNAHLFISDPVSGNGDVYATSDEYEGHVSPVIFDGTPGNTFSGTPRQSACFFW